jgi:hypothetical protein
MARKTKTPEKPTGKHPGGAPTKFKPEYIQAIIEFFDVEPYRVETTEKSTEYFSDGRVKKETEKTRLIPNKMPTLFGFSRSIGVAYTTVYRWAEKGDSTDDKFSEFRNAYKDAKELQKEFIISVGMAGAAPAPFAIFTAKNVTDMRDKQEIDHGGNLKIQIVDYSNLSESPDEDSQ